MCLDYHAIELLYLICRIDLRRAPARSDRKEPQSNSAQDTSTQIDPLQPLGERIGAVQNACGSYSGYTGPKMIGTSQTPGRGRKLTKVTLPENHVIQRAQDAKRSVSLVTMTRLPTLALQTGPFLQVAMCKGMSGRYTKDLAIGLLRTFVWICFFCNNQERILNEKSQEGSDDLESTFQSRLRSIGHVLVLFDNWSKPAYLTLGCSVSLPILMDRFTDVSGLA